MNHLVESVLNFSEGRDQARVDAIVDAMREVPGVFLLDCESDADHNRSVITIAGAPEPVAEAALRGVGKAAQLIDLTRQTGAHPRVGATDVVPFIPIEGITLDECVALARKVGREIWDRYRIPVYFYEAAAQHPERVNLENIRKGQFEGLRDEVLVNPDRSPDIGEPRLHPTAGATVVGARKFLIAYNINLNTPDVGIAKQIAKSIRFSSGGLRYVKAMGVDLRARGIAQVSINLTDFEQTPIHRVFESVRREAERYGVTIAGSEIVGLIPRKALELTSEFYLQLENFSPALVLENRISELIGQAAPTLSAAAQPLLDAIARPAATPAGGSVAALAGAMGAALGEMVAGISLKKKSLVSYHPWMSQAIEDFQASARALTQAADDDARCYQSVIGAHRLPKDTPEQRQYRDAAIQRALKAAIDAPLRVARQAAVVFEKLGQLEGMAAPSMLSDVQVGRSMASSAVQAALKNVAVNLDSITDADLAARLRSESRVIQSRLSEHPVSAIR